MNIKPNCPMCFALGAKVEMMFHHSMVHHSLYDKTSGLGIYARDEGYKCPICYFFAVFGVPITKVEYDRYIKEHGGLFEFSKPKRLDWQKDVVKRLQALGYMDVAPE